MAGVRALGEEPGRVDRRLYGPAVVLAVVCGERGERHGAGLLAGAPAGDVDEDA
jgi:hypothetical protein